MPFGTLPKKTDETQHATDCITGHYGEFTGYPCEVDGKHVIVCDECNAFVEIAEPLEACKKHKIITNWS